MRIPIVLYLFFNALAYSLGKEMRTFQEYMFQLSSLVLILSPLYFGPTNYKPSIFEKKINVSILVLFAWFMVVFVRDKTGWPILLNTFLGLGAYLTVIRNLKATDLKFILKGLIWLSVIVIGYLGLQHLNFDPRGQYLRNNPTGVPRCSFLGLEAHCGIYLAMVMPIFMSMGYLNIFTFSWKGMSGKELFSNVMSLFLFCAYIGFMFFVLIPAHSTGAYFGLLGAVLFYLWHRKRIMLWLCLIPLVAGAWLFLVKVDNPMGMQTTRIDMWKKVIQDAHIKPFGYGLDAFRNDNRTGAIRYFKNSFNDTTVRVINKDGGWFMAANTPKEFIEKVERNQNPLDFWDHPHNEYIWLFFETGHPGLIILGFILFYLFKAFQFSMKRPLTVALGASIVSILIFSIVQFPFHVARIGHIIPIILGMFIVSARDEI